MPQGPQAQKSCGHQKINRILENRGSIRECDALSQAQNIKPWFIFFEVMFFFGVLLGVGLVSWGVGVDP